MNSKFIYFLLARIYKNQLFIINSQILHFFPQAEYFQIDNDCEFKIQVFFIGWAIFK